MAYQSLYITYRPKDFEEIVGQDHIKQTLKNAIDRNQIAHAYLFCGPRGTGKTSVAKIFAKAINCVHKEKAPCNDCEFCDVINMDNHPDIVEIDAASNNGVDEIRDLVDKVKYAPIELTYKVYIIDEVHMLTQGAFNALLKTLEEPPEHVIFILATTEVHKVLPTIISRCQRYDFDRLSQKNIIHRLQYVFNKEKIEVHQVAVELIASLADGAMRNALTISEQVISYAQGKITVDDVQKVYKIVGPTEKLSFLKSLLSGNLEETLKLLQGFESESIEYKRFINDLVQLVKDSVVYSLTQNDDLISQFESKQIIELANTTSSDNLIRVIDELLKVSRDTTYNGLYQEYLQIASIKLCHEFKGVDNHDLVEIVEDDVETTEVKENIETSASDFESVNLEPIIECMVLGNKELKQSELMLWPKMKDYETDFKYRKVAPWLSKANLAISDDSFIVLVSDKAEEAAFINSESNKEIIVEIVEIILNTKKKVLAITREEFDQAVEEFRNRHKTKSLPDEKKLRERNKKEKNKEVVIEKVEPSPQDKIQEFFGDSLTIIE